ncbi:hypothetical protein ACFXG4_51200 [Nocardia sp. NPDC059246]|uniref:hypothetical protein n=1 Tax=unclassified Nocardia TaxID=2637762 RepID=UPI0036B2A70F
MPHFTVEVLALERTLFEKLAALHDGPGKLRTSRTVCIAAKRLPPLRHPLPAHEHHVVAALETLGRQE